MDKFIMLFYKFQTEKYFLFFKNKQPETIFILLLATKAGELLAGLCFGCAKTARIVIFCASPRLAELSFPDGAASAGGPPRPGARNPGGIPDTQEQIPLTDHDPTCPLGFLHLPHPAVEVYLKGGTREQYPLQKYFFNQILLQACTGQNFLGLGIAFSPHS